MHISQNISVDFEYTVSFSDHIFSPENQTLRTLLSEADSKLPSRVFFVIEQAIVDANPALLAQLGNYCTLSSSVFSNVSSPLILPGGEDAKKMNTVELICSHLLKHKLCRQSYMVQIGGGAFLDVCGFAASIFHRGIRQLRVPTTVLAQADSGVGVKNAINLHGKKNLIGCFAPPVAVINDFSFLETLPDREWIAGISEAFKVALIKDKDLFHWLCKNIELIKKRDSAAMKHLVQRCAELHLDHIKNNGDPFEFGSARPLDFGHWLAHKLEMLSDGQIRHGEAVAVGLVLDSYYAFRKELLSQDVLEQLMDALEKAGFNLKLEWLRPFVDKPMDLQIALDDFQEHLGGELHITLPDQLGQKLEVNELDLSLIKDAIIYVLNN